MKFNFVSNKNLLLDRRPLFYVLPVEDDAVLDGVDSVDEISVVAVDVAPNVVGALVGTAVVARVDAVVVRGKVTVLWMVVAAVVITGGEVKQQYSR